MKTGESRTCSPRKNNDRHPEGTEGSLFGFDRRSAWAQSRTTLAQPRITTEVSAMPNILRNAVAYRVPCITTISGARASVEAIVSRRRDPIRVWSLQEIHGAAAPAKVSVP